MQGDSNIESRDIITNIEKLNQRNINRIAKERVYRSSGLGHYYTSPDLPKHYITYEKAVAAELAWLQAKYEMHVLKDYKEEEWIEKINKWIELTPKNTPWCLQDYLGLCDADYEVLLKDIDRTKINTDLNEFSSSDK